jgi:hypothetical protein
MLLKFSVPGDSISVNLILTKVFCSHMKNVTMKTKEYKAIRIYDLDNPEYQSCLTLENEVCDVIVRFVWPYGVG